ncbi:MAG: GDSL-type esterase/lipase family protein, partial [Muribaculaceae bacterium]
AKAGSTLMKLSVLHIGDSHIQGGMLSEALRQTLQSKYGNGGRGLIAPLKLAGTNQPADYSFTSANRAWKATKLTSHKRREGASLTGIAVAFASPALSLNIGVNNIDDSFSSVTLLHAPAKGNISANSTEMSITKTGNDSLSYATTFALSSACQQLPLYNLSGISELWGAILHNNRSGVVLHSIGNNGACYQHYNQLDSFAARTAVFAPDLIIISLGTNEAFGNCKDPNAIKNEIHRLVSALQKSNPEAAILLTTPMECDRLQRSRRGRRRRRTVFTTNTNCLTVRNIIMQYGAENSIAVWDLYTVAGGKGSAAKWVANSLLAKRDHVHCSAEGYRLQGKLLAEALIQSLTEE